MPSPPPPVPPSASSSMLPPSAAGPAGPASLLPAGAPMPSLAIADSPVPPSAVNPSPVPLSAVASPSPPSALGAVPSSALGATVAAPSAAAVGSTRPSPFPPEDFLPPCPRLPCLAPGPCLAKSATDRCSLRCFSGNSSFLGAMELLGLLLHCGKQAQDEQLRPFTLHAQAVDLAVSTPCRQVECRLQLQQGLWL